MKQLSVADEGWITLAMAAIAAKEELKIAIGGQEAFRVVDRMRRVSMPMIRGIGKEAASALKGLGGVVPAIAAATELTPVLASFGAVGGAAGSVGFVAGTAAVQGWKLSFTFSLGNVFDPTDDQLFVTLSPP